MDHSIPVNAPRPSPVVEVPIHQERKKEPLQTIPEETEYEDLEELQHIQESIQACEFQLGLVDRILELHRELYSSLSQPSISSQTKMQLIQKINGVDKDIKEFHQDLVMDLRDLNLEL
jgi:hypothetical protein